MKVLFFITILLSSTLASASVWSHDPNKHWTPEWQNKYSNWVATKVKKSFFKDLGSPYSQLKVDCADVQYGLIAYFAREHKLPFAVNNGRFTNNTTKFDSYKNKHTRFAVFMKYVIANFGTESLVKYDTYPVALNDIAPGDVFMYKIGKPGAHTRHTYIIKNINPDGTFDVMYSTQANAKTASPLKRKPTYMFKKAPTNKGKDYRRWGFRRMKPAQYADVKQENIPGASFEQYTKANSMSKSNFFSYIKKINQTVSESPQKLLSRHFSGMCASLNERVEIVDQGLAYLKSIGGRCMDFGNYDAHSTPSRDSGLMDDYDSYFNDLEILNIDGELDKVSNTLKQDSFAVFNPGRTPQELDQLAASCPVRFGTNSSGNKLLTDQGTFRDALFDGKVSFHPNDNLYQRWGVNKGTKTNCKQFYGYPEN